VKKFLFLSLAACCVISAHSQTKILCIGESSTSSFSPGYRGKLKTLLNGIGTYTFIGPLTDTDGKHAGYTGEPCYTLYNDGTGGKHRITNLKTSGYDPDVILLLEGTNDCGWAYQGYTGGRTLASELSTLIDKICITFPDAKLYVSAIMPMSYTAYDYVPTPNGMAGSNVGTYNNAIANTVAYKVANGKSVYYTGANAVLLSDLSGDGIHPLQKGYDKIALAFYNALHEVTTSYTASNNKLTGVSAYTQNGDIIVDLSGTGGVSSISIINSLGVVVKSIQGHQAITSIAIPLKGLYFVRVLNGRKSFLQKVIVN